MTDELPQVTLGTYYVRADATDEFERVIVESWVVLRQLGFIGWDEPELFRSIAEPLRYVEITRWMPGMMAAAHAHPEPRSIWTRLAAVVEPHTPDVVERGFMFDEFVRVAVGGDD